MPPIHLPHSSTGPQVRAARRPSNRRVPLFFRGLTAITPRAHRSALCTTHLVVPIQNRTHNRGPTGLHCVQPIQPPRSSSIEERTPNVSCLGKKLHPHHRDVKTFLANNCCFGIGPGGLGMTGRPRRAPLPRLWSPPRVKQDSDLYH